MFSNEQWWAKSGGGPHVDFKIWAAGGGGTADTGAGAGSGGYVEGTTYQASGTTLYLVVGQGGTAGASGRGGGGGGYSGVFTGGTPSQANALLIAGGGGG